MSETQDAVLADTLREIDPFKGALAMVNDVQHMARSVPIPCELADCGWPMADCEVTGKEQNWLNEALADGRELNDTQKAELYEMCRSCSRHCVEGAKNAAQDLIGRVSLYREAVTVRTLRAQLGLEVHAMIENSDAGVLGEGEIQAMRQLITRFYEEAPA